MKFTLKNPYPASSAYQLKGNLHAHTNLSDGKRAIQDVIDDYAERGYDFLMISDHDKYADLSKVNLRGMILISGSEISAKGPHILQAGSHAPVAADANRQQVIDDINNSGAFPIICHPRWDSSFNHCPQGMLDNLRNYNGLEIYNGGVRFSPGSPDATGNWDMLLSRGRVLWGHASDDSHSENEVERGWDIVFVDEKTEEAILEALRNGAFYCSTGVSITDITVNDNQVHIKTANADLIEVVTADGYVIKEAESNEITYKIDRKMDLYCRFACYGRGLKMAWTQPFFYSPAAFLKNSVKIPVLDGQPVLSGNLDDPLWSQSAEISEFIDLTQPNVAPAATKAKLFCNGKSMFLAFKCDSVPNNKGSKLSWEEAKLGSIDNRIELFLNLPDGKGDDFYYHILFSDDGSFRGKIGISNYDAWQNWHDAVTVKSSKDDNNWILEVELPLSIFDLTGISAGDSCNINLVRNIMTKKTRNILSWCWTGNNPHRPLLFGKADFIKVK